MKAVRSLLAHIDERPVGTLTEADDLWQFTYEAEWIAAEDGFALSPALPLTADPIRDGGTLRPVQWYFDNLLPEDKLREATKAKAGIKGDDAFALLEYLGAESAGSITLVSADHPEAVAHALKPLTDAALSARIRNLPATLLADTAPKRMSVAGAQHKLLVAYRDEQLFEPVGSTASTHILKPDHPDPRFRCSVANEFFVMRLARGLGLEVPVVRRRYVPEPVYLIDRFDRVVSEHRFVARRLHIVDACQLLNKASGFKYSGATLDSLREIVQRCRNRAIARQRLFQWLAFNTLIGNNDNHLKNLSFMVSHEGIDLAPHYDLLSTAAYDTRAMADDKARWPHVELTIELPGARTFGEVTRHGLVAAAEALGIPARVATRQLDTMLHGLPSALAAITTEIATVNDTLAKTARPFLAAESRLLRTIEHVVIADMARQLT